MNPALVYFDEKYEKHPPCSLPFATSPSSLLSLHLKLLIENTASVSLQKPNLISSQECLDYLGKLNTYGLSPVEDNSDKVSEITLENLGSSLDQGAISSRRMPFGHLKVETDALSLSDDGDGMRCSENSQNSEVSHRDVAKNKSNVAVVQFRRFPCCARLWEGAEKSCSSSEDYCSPDKSNGGCNSCLHSTIVHAKPFAGVVEESFDKGSIVAKSSSGLILDVSKHSINSTNPTAPPSIWHQNSHRSASLTSGPLPKLWQEDFMQNGFFSGSKKPGKQLLTLLPSGGLDISSKPQSNRRKVQNYRRTKASDAKRISVPQSFAESLPCDANVLITAEDRGWRECGAQVVLDSYDQKDWMICIKFSGATKYVHKAQQFLQPGITNQYTHDVIWKGGKNWALEFTDRYQWLHFKEMHEECCNRNIRASSVRNIPIPGVRLIANGDDNIVEVPFIRNSSNYIRLVGTEVDMALDPSHVLYDMDSSDEEWILKMRNSSHSHWSKMSKVTYDIFERIMDMFEKLSYIQQCDEFTNNEIERFIANVGPLDFIKAIHEHWQQKRQKKGLPLIRQFQPALWEYYQRQLKKWESFVSQMHSSSSGCQDRECSVKKPPMFAFCLKPRGLEVPNKWLTQRSHKRSMFTGHRRTFAREKDGYRSLGRKWNRVSVGEKKAFVANLCHESADSFDCLKFPSRSSQRDTIRKRSLTMDIDDSQKYQYAKHYRNNQRKTQMFPFPNDPEMLPSSYDGKSKGNAVQWSSGIYKRPSMKRSPSDRYRRHCADTDEFQLHDARAVAQHASNMVKLKREKAQWLVHRADLAIHKAMVALMIVEAMKASVK